MKNKQMVPILLTGLVILESVFLLGLIAARIRVRVSTKVSLPKGTVVLGPLYEALEYEAPDKKFEELVKEGGWIAFRPDGRSDTILSASAEAKRTNYVRILIANGANIGEAVDYERKKNNLEAVKLIEQMEAEAKR